ncbi:MAG: ABC transporter permease, partial [Alphaproteobacteria bacterium]|nr:ABC transporter permease [Alphaproteobacteria bacterium]MDX5416753.1 ABC transporter permease [Alphaproteobacteria bacterium]MDX5494137.1 ABC transporter permease [Alphaproteobacteria bacterium]
MTRDDTLSARAMRIFVPVAAGIIFLLLWEAFVTIREIPRFVLPAPSAIFDSLVENFGSLMGSLWVTLRVTIAAFLLAIVGGVGLAILFSQSRHVEMALFPYAIVLQVTP